VVVNDGLRVREEAHDAGLPHVTDAELSARLTAAKKTPERAWLNEVSSVVLQHRAAGLAVTACGAQVTPSPCGMAQRGEAGTHPKSHREAT